MDTAIITDVVKKALKQPRFAVLCNQPGALIVNGAEIYNDAAVDGEHALFSTRIKLGDSKLGFIFTPNRETVYVARHEGDEQMIEWLEAYSTR